MDIKRMHDMIETLTECAKHEFDKGIENIDTKEMGEVIDMIKDLAEAEYYRKISVAMDEAEYGEDYDYMGAYDEHKRKGYRGQPRDSKGRYMSRRSGRRGYEEPMYHIDPETYHMYPPEYWRDMDKEMGRMYYGGDTGTSANASHNMSGMTHGTSTRGTDESHTTHAMRDSKEGRSGMKRKGYMDSKEMGKDKGEKMKNLEEYMKELSMDVTEMIEGASPEEKNLLKQKMQMLMQKIV